MNKKIKIAIGFLLVIAIIIPLGMNTYKLWNSEWSCIAQECVEFAEGDDWVKQNCNLQNNEMICEFKYEEENFRVPLSGINVDDMISCKKYECASSVLISYNK